MRTFTGIIAILLALTGAGCGSDKVADTDTATVAETAAQQVTDASVGDEQPAADDAGTPASECSAAELESELPEDPDLPEPVEKTRQALFDAALACDFDRLGEIAAQAGEGFFSYTFGADEDPVAYWRRFDKRERILARLAQILTTPHVTVEDGGTYYAWPSVHRENPTQADWEALAASGAYSDQEIAQFERFGGYLGYRVGIWADGTWSFFIAGD